MKKLILYTATVCILALTLLTGCINVQTVGDSLAQVQNGSHTHTVTGNWEADMGEHWHVCDACGEAADKAAHTLKNGRCTVCGSDVIENDDGSGNLFVYNDHEDLTWLVTYADDGSVESESRTEYTYDNNGDVLTQKSYEDGVLVSAAEYACTADGTSYISMECYYYEDGSSDVYEYDGNRNLISASTCDADGAVLYSHQYDYNGSASWIIETEFTGDVLTAERTCSIDEDGMQHLITEILYNDDGSTENREYDAYDELVIEIYKDADESVTLEYRYEHLYDNNGHKTLTRTYENSVLIEEQEYGFGSDEEGEWVESRKCTTYHADGSRTVRDTDWENGEWSSEITYDANGGVLKELRYEYIKNEEGDSVGTKSYRNGVLFEEMHNVTDENGAVTGLVVTQYSEDGGKSVTEYDAEFNVLKETAYDAAGDVTNTN